MPSAMEDMDIDPIFEHESPIEQAYSQASVFLEDAFQYRSIQHKVDGNSLKLYRLYFSRPMRWGLGIVIFLDLALAFVEKPSSLTLSSDPRYRGTRPNPPCGITEGLEILFIICFICDVVIKSHFVGRRQFLRSRWLLVYCFVLAVSLVDIFVSLSNGCSEKVRIRRLLRPFFLLQNSSLMKKLLRAIKRTVPEIMSVLFLLFLHLWFFTMFGMLLFPQASEEESIARKECMFNSSDNGAACEGFTYFPKLEISLRSLFVLLTTANNPDVMMPVYTKNRFAALYFILFTIFGLYFLLNMLTAVIYNQFRGYVTSSLQASFFRRRLAIRASFQVLLNLQDPDSEVPVGHVSVEDVRRAVQRASIGKRCTNRVVQQLDRTSSGHLSAKDFQNLFDVRDSTARYRPAMSFVENQFLRRVQIIVAHKCFDYFGDIVAFVNVLLMSIYLDYEYNKIWKSSKSDLAVANLFFVLYYLLEQLVKLWAVGWQRYRSSKTSLYCGVVTVLLVLIEIIHLAVYGLPFQSHHDPDNVYQVEYDRNATKFFSLPNMFRVINMLIIFRLLRIIPNVKALSLVAETVGNLLKNLRPFVGIIVAIYYVFAILGMMLFEGVTDPSRVGFNITSEASKECGTFSQLQYYANNFDDFAAALVLLWDVMVVNNWHVFLKEYAKVVSGWAQLYFVAWYLISVILCINLFVALILEAFVNQWEVKQRRIRSPSLSSTTPHDGEGGTRTRFFEWFSGDMVEPQENELLQELRNHEYYRFAVQ